MSQVWRGGTGDVERTTGIADQLTSASAGSSEPRLVPEPGINQPQSVDPGADPYADPSVSPGEPQTVPANPIDPDEDDEELDQEPYFSTQTPTPATIPGEVGAAAATGRRKEAVARVRLVPGAGVWRVNGRPVETYLLDRRHRQVAAEPLRLVGRLEMFDVVVRVRGGGIAGQAGAIRLGVARALNEIDPSSYRPRLKAAGMLTRDSRAVERKKAGLKKARKAPQFSKR